MQAPAQGHPVRSCVLAPFLSSISSTTGASWLEDCQRLLLLPLTTPVYPLAAGYRLTTELRSCTPSANPSVTSHGVKDEDVST